MPYIGKSPEHGNFQELTDVSGSFNGSTTQFALTTRIGSIVITPVVEAALLISLDGVIQESTTDYTVSGTNITFTTAPASTVSFFGVVMGRQLDVGTPSDSTISVAKLASTFFTGATDIGAAIVDADLLLIDDGAGGTFRKTAASRLKTYVHGTGAVDITALDIDGGTDIGAAVVAADLFVVDDGAGGTNRKTTAARIKTFVEATAVAVTGNVTATGTVEPAGDTASNDNAAIGYTSAEGLILTGQGSTNDVTLKNDADGEVFGVPTGTTGVTFKGVIRTDDTTAATSTTDGSLQTDGGLSVAADAVIGDDLLLLSDAAVLSFGADSEVTVTHVHNDGLLLNTDMQLQFRDSAINIRSDADGDLDINADDEIELNSTLIDINGNVEISGTATTTGVHTFSATPVFPDGSIALADLDIDGGTDIGADIVDADLFIIDDGAGGTNRKTTASRMSDYFGGGKILQVVSAFDDEYRSYSNTKHDAMAEYTQLRCAITPAATSSKILLQLSLSIGVPYGQSGNGVSVVFKRGSTVVGSGDNTSRNSSEAEVHAHNNASSDVDASMSHLSGTFVDSPSSTSQITYGVFVFATHVSGGSATNKTTLVNSGGYNYNNVEQHLGASQLVAIEIGA